ncbi:hypothetical protein BD311DRAFT_773930 [Dichomitus squalens]|uniref:Uncharacterized protein n=1 Tax=Dichomitus squalens TaxID=114155 RepID=A0A4Q9N4R7_9APHY|nr:hypothetical protein BD311DRAFT_773930 [Dichomitus squalens]
MPHTSVQLRISPRASHADPTDDEWPCNVYPATSGVSPPHCLSPHVVTHDTHQLSGLSDRTPFRILMPAPAAGCVCCHLTVARRVAAAPQARVLPAMPTRELPVPCSGRASAGALVRHPIA